MLRQCLECRSRACVRCRPWMLRRTSPAARSTAMAIDRGERFVSGTSTLVAAHRRRILGISSATVCGDASGTALATATSSCICTNNCQYAALHPPRRFPASRAANLSRSSSNAASTSAMASSIRCRRAVSASRNSRSSSSNPQNRASAGKREYWSSATYAPVMLLMKPPETVRIHSPGPSRGRLCLRFVLDTTSA